MVGGFEFYVGRMAIIMAGRNNLMKICLGGFALVWLCLDPRK